MSNKRTLSTRAGESFRNATKKDYKLFPRTPRNAIYIPTDMWNIKRQSCLVPEMVPQWRVSEYTEYTHTYSPLYLNYHQTHHSHSFIWNPWNRHKIAALDPAWVSSRNKADGDTFLNLRALSGIFSSPLAGLCLSGQLLITCLGPAHMASPLRSLSWSSSPHSP